MSSYDSISTVLQHTELRRNAAPTVMVNVAIGGYFQIKSCLNGLRRDNYIIYCQDRYTSDQARLGAIDWLLGSC